MYRTYKNLYKVQPAISSIGQGKQRIKLPRDATITIDSVWLFLVLLLPARYLVAPIISLLVNPNDWPIEWLLAILLAGMGAYRAGKLDPAGKPISIFLLDLLKFMLRSRWHDGWEAKQPIKRRRREHQVFGVTLLDDGQAGSLPAKGKVEVFELRLPAALKVRRGNVVVSKWGNKLPVGTYKIEKGRVVPYQELFPKSKAPSLRRK